MSSPLEIGIERWFAIGWIVFGLSHLLHPGTWTELFRPLREHETGPLIVGALTLPIGLAVVFAHNVWVWDLPIIVTLTGWAMVAKSLLYLLFPRAARHVLPTPERMERGFVFVGAVAVLLGMLLAYDAFFPR